MPLGQPLQILDDRARRTTALWTREVRAAAHGPDPVRAALARHLNNAIKAESRRWTPRTVGLGLILALLYVFLQIFGRVSGLWLNPLARPVLGIGGLIAVVIIARADTRRRVAAQLAATAVAEGICGGCCYSLRDLPVEPDGCVVCPECGAAWQARRITRPHWATDASVRSRAEGGRGGTGVNWLVRFITLTPPPQQLLAPDDRGRFVSVVDSRLLLVPEVRRRELGSARVGAARRMLRRIRRVPRVLLALPELTIAALCLYSASSFVNGPDRGLTLVMLIPTSIFLLLGVGLLFSHAFYSPRQAARAMVGLSLCPSCARPLDGLPIDADGCAVCPECGGSWRPPTIGA